MVVLSVATVTVSGEPRISAVDGHFAQDRWWFGTSGHAAKARQLAARPAISAAYTPRDGYGVFVHGYAQRVEPGTAQFEPLHRRLVATYGHGAEGWPPPVVFFRIQPTWMTAFDSSAAQF